MQLGYANAGICILFLLKFKGSKDCSKLPQSLCMPPSEMETPGIIGYFMVPLYFFHGGTGPKLAWAKDLALLRLKSLSFLWAALSAVFAVCDHMVAAKYLVHLFSFLLLTLLQKN